MNAEDYKKLTLSEFIDQIGTKFIKGPFTFDGKTYDYKLIDKDGEDYCTAEQLEEWYVDIVSNVIKETEWKTK